MKSLKHNLIDYFLFPDNDNMMKLNLKSRQFLVKDSITLGILKIGSLLKTTNCE